jgi:hypothetical protein
MYFMQRLLRALVMSVSALACSCDKAPPVEAIVLPEPTKTATTLRRGSTATQYNLEFVGSAVEPLLRQAEAIGDGAQDITVSGWAVDTAARQAAGGVEVVVDGRGFKAEYGMDRVDVSAGLNEPLYRRSGFQFVFPPKTLPPGAHSVSLRIITANLDGYYDTPTVRLVVR